jgi:hypothetical protein
MGNHPAEADPPRRQDHPETITNVYWIVTALFCLQMTFTAYAELHQPQEA